MKKTALTKLPLLFIILSMLFLSACAKTGSDRYLTAAQLTQLDAFLPPPPTDTSEEHKAELEYIYWSQTHASRAQHRQAQSEFEFTPAAFKPVFGDYFTEERAPETFKFLARVLTEGRPPLSSQKVLYARLRPPASDSRIKPLDMAHFDKLSYPSGHSFNGMLCAFVLADIAPDKKDAILERGREIGWDRAVAGMHHPSDFISSRVLAWAVYKDMKKNQAFLDDLAKSKSELELLRSASK